MAWTTKEVEPHLQTCEEVSIMERLEGVKKCASWTPEQIIARCRNEAEQWKRRNSHGTGYRTKRFNCGEPEYHEREIW